MTIPNLQREAIEIVRDVRSALHVAVDDLRDGEVVESDGYSVVLEGTILSLMRSPEADARRYVSIDIGPFRVRHDAGDVDALYALIGGAEDPSHWYGCTSEEERLRVEDRVRSLAARMAAASHWVEVS